MACRRFCVRPRDMQQPGPGTHVAGLTLVLRTWHRLLRTDVEAPESGESGAFGVREPGLEIRGSRETVSRRG